MHELCCPYSDHSTLYFYLIGAFLHTVLYFIKKCFIVMNFTLSRLFRNPAISNLFIHIMGGYSKLTNGLRAAASGAFCMLASELTVHMLKCIVRGHVCCSLIHDSSPIQSTNQHPYSVEPNIDYRLGSARQKHDV